MAYRVQEGTGALIFKNKEKSPVELLTERVKGLEDKYMMLVEEVAQLKAGDGDV
ncbi:MAG: hypothetical protein GXZ11_01290 [Tissierellia bacterium]|nr:hypothetical protein [Tissierellia bacterium]